MNKYYYKIKNNPQVQRVINNKTFKKYEKWGFLLIWAGAIYVISSQPLNEFFVKFDFWHFIVRKLAHMFEFGVFAFLLFRVFSQTEKRHIYWNIFWTFIFSVLYAVSDEYHQYFVPNRHGVYYDVLIDSLGIILATWLIYLHYHHEKVRKEKYKIKIPQ